jgi:hypothetical protein
MSCNMFHFNLNSILGRLPQKGIFHYIEFKCRSKGLMTTPLTMGPADYVYTVYAFLESVDMCLLAD